MEPSPLIYPGNQKRHLPGKFNPSIIIASVGRIDSITSHTRKIVFIKQVVDTSKDGDEIFIHLKLRSQIPYLVRRNDSLRRIVVIRKVVVGKRSGKTNLGTLIQ